MQSCSSNYDPIKNRIDYTSSNLLLQDFELAQMVTAYIVQNNIKPTQSFINKYCLSEFIDVIGPTNISLKDIEIHIESMVSKKDKGANGIVFTPNYIIDYILKNTSITQSHFKIIDPGCGCGSFLVKAAQYISEKFHKSICDVINENLYGIDIVPKFVEATKLILSLLCMVNGENPDDLNFNIVCANSLTENWDSLFGVDGFDIIIGNPPYSNPHDMDDAMVNLIKTQYQTTKKGTTNIFYAFIEKSMMHLKENGNLGFIIPNNYLTIVAAQPLRKLLKQSKNISKIVDFGDNMVFSPVRTYNSLLFLNKSQHDSFLYSVMSSTKNVKSELENLKFESYDVSDLCDDGWALLPPEKLEIIRKIESFNNPIKKYIHTGIATLRDEVYLVDGFDESKTMYYKNVGNKKYWIEADIVRKLFKISDLDPEKPVESFVKYIICPYETKYQCKLNGTKTKVSSLISEEYFSSHYPNCYAYLSDMKSELDKRDHGKGVSPKWYAYGRTQSLNYLGRKLLFPTFSAKPKFMMLNDENALFCNGYVIVEDPDYDIEVLQKIVNSTIMEYYVTNTSYPIEGGFYCYQKKFIQKFTIPDLSDEDIQKIKKGNKKEVDELLIQKYSVPFLI